MPTDVALKRLDAASQVSIPPCVGMRNRGRSLACVIAAASYAVTLAGCDRTAARSPTASGVTNTATSARSRTPIPQPARALLYPQPEPDCEFKTTEENVDDRQKLDYERQCYRHAEMIARVRLQRLQGAVDNMIKAVMRRDGNGS
jgi:hypothetical protein